MIFGISWEYLEFMVRMFLATHLASSKVIEDCRNGLPGDQLKLVPTAPNHPSRKFRVIQLWDKGTGSAAAAGATLSGKTVLTPFITRDLRTSNRRRWPSCRASPLKVDLVEEARKVYELYLKTLEEVQQYRAQCPVWECGDDGLDPLPDETMKEYCARVRPRLHQEW